MWRECSERHEEVRHGAQNYPLTWAKFEDCFLLARPQRRHTRFRLIGRPRASTIVKVYVNATGLNFPVRRFKFRTTLPNIVVPSNCSKHAVRERNSPRFARFPHSATRWFVFARTKSQPSSKGGEKKLGVYKVYGSSGPHLFAPRRRKRPGLQTHETVCLRGG